MTIVDAGLRKDLDLRVVSPVEQFGPLPEKSIWPSIYRLLGDEIRRHRSTIVFANNRRAVERITAFLNEEEEIARAHHGSVALEVRQQIETALKEGGCPRWWRRPRWNWASTWGRSIWSVRSNRRAASPAPCSASAGPGTSSARRARAGSSPRRRADLLEQAVLAREMAAGRVEEIRVPINCLDVLAQQLVACAAMDDWSVPELYALVRRAYPYRDLSPQAFETTLEMISGRYRFTRAQRPSGTKSGRRHAGSLAAARRAGTASTIACSPCRAASRWPWSTAAPSRTRDSTPPIRATERRIGELDEEFIYERRVGDTFLLGTNAWRLERIEADRVHRVAGRGSAGDGAVLAAARAGAAVTISAAPSARSSAS